VRSLAASNTGAASSSVCAKISPTTTSASLPAPDNCSSETKPLEAEGGDERGDETEDESDEVAISAA